MGCGCGGSKKRAAGARGSGAAARPGAERRQAAAPRGKNAPAQPGFYWNGPQTRDDKNQG
jgi:hypothetical protein